MRSEPRAASDTTNPAEPLADAIGAPRRPRRSADVRPGVLGAIAVGGALGTLARYGMAQWLAVAPDSFPWATFWTNVSGSLALGVILTLIFERFPPNRYLRPFAASGFLGAYTTYSTFAVETDLLIRNGRTGLALTYAASSVVCGIAAVLVGTWAARAVPLRRSGGRR
jgi:CrcB protein